MFCPKCGNAEQSPETYCRQCGIFLHDPSKPFKKKERPPEEHLRANTFLTVLSGATSILMAVWLYSFLLRHWDVPPIVNYIVAGLLTANFAWQVQVFMRTMMLKKQINRLGRTAEVKPISFEENLASEPSRMLNSADFSDIVPPSVTDRTTKHLADAQKRSS